MKANFFSVSRSRLLAMGLLVSVLAGLAASSLAVTDVPAAGQAANKTSETAIPAKKDQSRTGPLQEAEYQKKVSQWIVRLLSQAHYRPHKLDDAFSREILDNFIKTLDPNRVYFYASDIKAFQKYANVLDDALKEGQVEPAFAIWNRYTQRINERMEKARELVDKGFDFSKDESYQWDRENAPWPVSQAEMDELWRKRVKNDFLSLKLAGKDDEKSRKTLQKRYKRIQKRVAETSSEDVFQYFINSYASLIEPHTSYLAPRSSKNFKINMSLSLEGIGALLGAEDEYTTIQRIIKGGPASMDGRLKKGDRILAVGQGEEGPMEDVIGWRLDDVVDKIRGPKGSTLRLLVINKDEPASAKPREIKLVRDKVKLEQQAAQYKILKVKEGGMTHKIGVIVLPTFYLDFEGRMRGDPDYRSTTRDVKKIIDKLKAEGVEGIVMDLRGNGGGSLVEATDLTGLFIEKGPVVQIKDSRGFVEVNRDRDSSVAWEGPLIVLVNKLSASASEIFAAALQDYGRAVIVGEQTFGKGTVQNMLPLDSYVNNKEHPAGQLKLTMAQFFRINGGSTQHRGVIPDVAFPKHPGTDKYGESELENALPWSSIKRASYRVWNDLTALVPILRQQFLAREKVNPEFDFLKQDQAYYAEMKADKMVSLNLEKRKAEADKLEARKAERKARRQAIAAGKHDPALSEVELVFDSADATDKPPVLDEDGEPVKDDEAEDRVDYELHETARILSDWLDLQKQRLAKNSKKKAS